MAKLMNIDEKINNRKIEAEDAVKAIFELIEEVKLPKLKDLIELNNGEFNIWDTENIKPQFDGIEDSIVNKIIKIRNHNYKFEPVGHDGIFGKVTF